MPDPPIQDYMDLPERELENLYAQGDLVAGQALWQRHEQELERRARRYSGQHLQAARDALDATRDRILDPGTPEKFQSRHDEGVRWLPWTTVILRNETIKIFAELSKSGPSGLLDVGDICLGPPIPVQEQRTKEALQCALSQLTPKERELLELRYTDDMTFEKMGAKLHCATSTARARLLRVLKTLEYQVRRWMRQENDEDTD